METRVHPISELPQDYDAEYPYLCYHPEKYGGSGWAVCIVKSDDGSKDAYVLPTGLVNALEGAKERGRREVRDAIKNALAM